ncbi:hypothetical protein F4801DRAFT_476231 [Xylaria longipes]|nr:hypothetical protein F4801DRAFT_476231 [Xylaria longipes]
MGAYRPFCSCVFLLSPSPALFLLGRHIGRVAYQLKKVCEDPSLCTSRTACTRDRLCLAAADQVVSSEGAGERRQQPITA